jgi:hypothetical protein
MRFRSRHSAVARGSSRRVLPRPGQPVTVLHLDARLAAVVLEVHEGGRRLVVEAEDGSVSEFVLRGATAVFTAEPGSAWPRLVFDG